MARLFGAVLAALLVAASPAAGQILRGTIVDSATGQPLPNTQVTAFTATRAKLGVVLTDSSGGFTFPLQASGSCVLLIRRVGYAPAVSRPISVSAFAVNSVRVRLRRAPVSLDTITVVAEHGPSGKRVRWLADVGFYDRWSRGWGSFLTREDIEEKAPLVVSDVLRELPGLQVHCVGPLSCRVVMRGANTMFIGKVCAPTLVLDGSVVSVGGTRGSDNVDVVDPHNLEAIEVYPSPAGVPVQYSGYMSPCGAILLWSRRGP